MRFAISLVYLEIDFMAVFTIITGIVTLIGFVFQLQGLFPQYKRYYTAITFILFGLTAGMAIASLRSVTINLPISLTARNLLGLLLFFGTGLLVFVCFSSVAVITDKNRRNEISKIGSAVSGFLIFLLLFFPNVFFPLTPDERPMYLTYDEQVECALRAIEKQDFERSKLLINDLINSLTSNDKRRSALEGIMAKVVEQQAKLPSVRFQEGEKLLEP